MRYHIKAIRLQEGKRAQVGLLVYDQIFDANEDTADEIGEMAGSSTEEAIRCDVAAEQERG